MEQNKYLVSIGNNIKRLRKAAGLTQEELSEKMGITAQYLSYVESGSRSPSFEVITAASDVLNVSPADLFEENTGTGKHKEIAAQLSQMIRPLSKDDQDRIVKIVSQCVRMNKGKKS